MNRARPSLHTGIAWVLLLLALGACGPRSMKQRLAHGEKRTDEATLLLNDAERELQNLEADRAEEKLTEAKELLVHPDVELSPEGELLRGQLTELTARVPKVREERARKEREAREERERQALMAAVEKQRDAVVQAMDAVTVALIALEQKDAGRAQVDAVFDAVKRARERQQAGKELETKSPDYAASARNTAKRLEQAEARARLVQRVTDFVSGPYSASQEAKALERKAQRERDLEKRLALYTDAHQRFRRCGEEAEKLLAELPEFARRPLPAAGRAPTLQAAASGCGKKAGTLQRTLTKLEKAKAKADKKARANKRKKKA